MTRLVRRLALALLLGGALLAGGGSPTSVTAQSSCDPSYPDFCIPPASEVGYLNCADVGATDFTVYAPDPHGFDGDSDGIGCESGGATSAPAPIAASTGSCDPSYPEICLTSSPDLDCASVGFALTVIHDPSIGAYDPHGFDADADGIGCESW